MAGLYLHIPFCAQRCTYCDFYFVTSLRGVEDFVEAVCLEIERAAESSAPPEPAPMRPPSAPVLILLS